MYKYFLLSIFLLIFSQNIFSQVQINKSDSNAIDYNVPKEYEIGGITVSGIKYLDQNVLIHLTGLNVGDKIMIPGEEIAQAIEKLWKQGLFSDVKITSTKIMGGVIFLDVYLQERPRLSKFSFSGVKKSEADDLREKIKLTKGSQVTDNIIANTKRAVKDYFIDKGYYNAVVVINQENDTTLANNVILKINVDKIDRIKIKQITFNGNTSDLVYKQNLKEKENTFWNRHFSHSPFNERKLRRAMKETKQKRWWGLFKPSKYIESVYKDDLNKVIERYNEYGYRDARIVSDTVYQFDKKKLCINVKVEEGPKYYFRNITWVGNTKYTSDKLNLYLSIKKGEIFDQKILDEKLNYSPDAVSSLYMDNGYLFFSVQPVEILVENDSIDLEMRIYEGKQAMVNKVSIIGNTKTNEHVIRREIRTKPGELFSRSDIIRTQRELAQLGYFDPEKLNVNPTPNPVDGTVDLEYIVEEKPSDQIELSGGWGANMIVGTLGVSFNNFAARKMFSKGAWRPLPSGDGQRLSVRAQSNGTYYQAYNMSFVEPWLGGKKPTSLSVSVFHSIQSNGTKIGEVGSRSMKITGGSLGLGKRLKWPDDYFSIYSEVSYQHYNLHDWSYFVFKTGQANNVSLKLSFSRNSSGPNPIFPITGSSFSLSAQATPPYSLLNGKDYSILSQEEKYKWIEYHKWIFKASWFSKLLDVGDKSFVLNTRASFGFLGYYNTQARSPFEGFNVGGDGLSGYSLYGRETIALRGYDNGALTPGDGGNLYEKFTMELRFPFSLNPNATIYGLVFAEGGNCWTNFDEYDPFTLKRSAGAGIRIFLPMFGMLGVDWGYGFDEIPYSPGTNKGQFHFVIGYSIE